MGRTCRIRSPSKPAGVALALLTATSAVDFIGYTKSAPTFGGPLRSFTKRSIAAATTSAATAAAISAGHTVLALRTAAATASSHAAAMFGRLVGNGRLNGSVRRVMEPKGRGGAGTITIRQSRSRVVPYAARGASGTPASPRSGSAARTKQTNTLPHLLPSALASFGRRPTTTCVCACSQALACCWPGPPRCSCSQGSATPRSPHGRPPAPSRPTPTCQVVVEPPMWPTSKTHSRDAPVLHCHWLEQLGT